MNCNKPKVLIIILNYLTYKMTLELIKSILERLEYENYDVMVIDNCSPNESAEVLEKCSKTLHYIFYANHQNSGYASGNNLGMRYAIENGYDYSWILNNDIQLVDNKILQKMVILCEDKNDVSCIGPEIIDINGVITAPYIERPSTFSLTLGAYYARSKRRRFIGQSGYVYRVFGCCMLLRNIDMKRIEYMDERTFLYYEEEILAERLRKIDKKCYYLANTRIVHLESMSVNLHFRGINTKKIKTVLSSMNVYLKYYLKLSWIERLLCKAFKVLILVVRG